MDKKLTTTFQIDDEITLRAFAEGDAEQVAEAVLRNREHLEIFMHWMTPDYSVESAKDFVGRSIAAVEEKTGLGFGIFRARYLIGSIGFVYFDWVAHKTEMGYWIDKHEEGKGIITNACMHLIQYAFDDLGLNRIEIRCSTENLRSAAIPERLGFRKEGVLRQVELRNGRLHDFSVYGLLADDPRVW
jgi:ribosomal-protein-serine acetyltransferase